MKVRRQILFLGAYNNKIDKKGRLAIPFQYRNQLSDSAVICRDVYGKSCLCLYPAEAWEKFTEKVNALPSAEGNRLKRFLYSGSCNVEFDAQGRTLIPAKLREYATLEGEVAVIGMGERLELWNANMWSAEDESYAPESIADIAAKYDL